ncbi:Mo25-like protein [Tuber brumale]|nr:Mo25-like protein [Tuber brumale]
MSFLFGRNRQKTPQDLVRAVRESISRMDVHLERRRASEDVSRLLAQMKVVLQGNAETDPIPDQVQMLALEVYAIDLLPLLANNMARLDFEAKKDVTALFNGLLRYCPQPISRFPTVDYLHTNRPDTLITLVKGYENKDVANNCGTILRESFKHQALAHVVLYDEIFWRFFDYVQGGSFDIASDAFGTFRELLTKHKLLVAQFLGQNYVRFFLKYNTLLVSPNYVTKRQSIKLLGEILLDRANYNIMLAYVDSPDHLKLTMNLLRDKSKNIQYEAFHVFKVFVANPKKSKPVQDILLKNREKLLAFLPKFHDDRREDEQFIDEKGFLMKQIIELGNQPQQPQGAVFA